MLGEGSLARFTFGARFGGLMENSIGFSAEASSTEEIYRLLKRDVADRLRNSCSDWSPSDFDALVEDVTRTKLKYPRMRRDRFLLWSN